MIPDLEVLPIQSLSELTQYLNGHGGITPHENFSIGELPELETQTDFQEIKGQEHAKRV